VTKRDRFRGTCQVNALTHISQTFDITRPATSSAIARLQKRGYARKMIYLFVSWPMINSF